MNSTVEPKNDETSASLKEVVQHLAEQVTDLRRATELEFKNLRALVTDHVDSSKSSVRQSVANNAQEVVQLIEALGPLYSKIPQPRDVMPLSGGFAMDTRALLHLATLIEKWQPKRILELGGGTSTIWLGYLTERTETEIISVDHLEDYRVRTNGYIRRHGFTDRIECRLAPLEDIDAGDGTYQWYAESALDDVSGVDFLLVDGPPKSAGVRARYPALPRLHGRLTPGALIVLDDQHRKDEQDILRSWLDTVSGYKHIEDGVSRLGVLAPTHMATRAGQD